MAAKKESRTEGEERSKEGCQGKKDAKGEMKNWKIGKWGGKEEGGKKKGSDLFPLGRFFK